MKKADKRKFLSALNFYVQRFLVHADLQMATRYVQDVSAQTDRVIENSRKYVMQTRVSQIKK